MNKVYGYSLSLDLHVCDIKKFNRKSIKMFFKVLCQFTNMTPEKLSWWDYEGEDMIHVPIHLSGISAVQFITTSSIVIHSLDKLGKVFIDFFSCKEFDPNQIREFCANFFAGVEKRWSYFERI